MEEEKVIQGQIEQTIELMHFLQKEAKTLLKIAAVITTALEKGKKVLVFGNGGSAADAQHIACELSGKFYLKRQSLPALALTTNTSVLTSIGNDYSYEEIFSHQVQGLALKGDVVIGLSTSGESENVIRGIEEASRLGAITIAFSGKGGKLKKLSQYALAIPSTDTPRVQEAHITAAHIICFLVEQKMFGKRRNA
ncbi:MAG: D-sedoheptulose-7-phosphate isomerase [Dehalococcoidia bacterium]